MMDIWIICGNFNMLGVCCEIDGMGRIKIPMFILFSIGIFLIHMGFLIGILIPVADGNSKLLS